MDKPKIQKDMEYFLSRYIYIYLFIYVNMEHLSNYPQIANITSHAIIVICHTMQMKYFFHFIHDRSHLVVKEVIINCN